MQFSIFIDESGEAGISKVREGGRHGASPYFVLGAVICQGTSEVLAQNAVLEFRNLIGKSSWKHATELSHSEKVYFARELGRLPVRYFSLISFKKTLGDYKGVIDLEAQKYYNKCLKYLLEAICTYLGKYTRDPDDLNIILENRNHDYDAMYRYLNTVKENPIYPQSKALELLNPFAISTKKKGESDLLEIADFVAHSVYQCTNRSKSNLGIPEPRYFRELSSRFAGNEQNLALGAGLKCIHSLEGLKLDADIEQLFSQTKVNPPATPRK